MSEMKNVGTDARKIAAVLMNHAARNVDHDVIVETVYDSLEAAGIAMSEADLLRLVDEVHARVATAEVLFRWEDDLPYG